MLLTECTPTYTATRLLSGKDTGRLRLDELEMRAVSSKQEGQVSSVCVWVMDELCTPLLTMLNDTTRCYVGIPPRSCCPSLCQSRILLFDGSLPYSILLCFETIIPINTSQSINQSVMFPSLVALAKASYTSAPTAALAGRTFKRAQKGLFNGKMKRFGG